MSLTTITMDDHAAMPPSLRDLLSRWIVKCNLPSNTVEITVTHGPRPIVKVKELRVKRTGHYRLRPRVFHIPQPPVQVMHAFPRQIIAWKAGRDGVAKSVTQHPTSTGRP